MSKQLKKEEKLADVEKDGQLENCFIITPIGSPDSDIYKKTTGLLEAVIEPVLKKLGLQAIPAHQIASPGSIPKQILRHIVNDRLVIANLTGLNPNVMYELAVRHAVKLPLVMLAEFGTELPFDVKDQRTIFYSDTYVGVEACKKQLEAAINLLLGDNYEPENPIYDAIETNQIIKNIAPESKEEYLIKRLDNIESALGVLVKNKPKELLSALWAGHDDGKDVHKMWGNTGLSRKTVSEFGFPIGDKFIIYLTLDDPSLADSITKEVIKIIKALGIDYSITQAADSVLVAIFDTSVQTRKVLTSTISKLPGVKNIKD